MVRGRGKHGLLTAMRHRGVNGRAYPSPVEFEGRPLPLRLGDPYFYTWPYSGINLGKFRFPLRVDNFASRSRRDWGSLLETDFAYFRQRASEERTAALAAREPRVRAAHVELAERYEDLVRAIAAQERQLGPLEEAMA